MGRGCLAGQSKKDRRFRHEGLEHRRCAKDVFCPCAPLRVFSNESGLGSAPIVAAAAQTRNKSEAKRS